jgi:hypothetical protein
MSCKIFQAITESVCRMMARSSFFVRSYIDDFVCVGKDEVTCKRCYDELIRLLESLDLLINWKKVCAPTRFMTFLGVVINCQSRTLALPDVKVSELLDLLTKLVQKSRVTKLTLLKKYWAS